MVVHINEFIEFPPIQVRIFRTPKEEQRSNGMMINKRKTVSFAFYPSDFFRFKKTRVVFMSKDILLTKTNFSS